jgi:hypothetical protein
MLQQITSIFIQSLSLSTHAFPTFPLQQETGDEHRTPAQRQKDCC